MKKKGIRMINQANTKRVAMIYVINIQIHLLFVSLCQKMIHHSSASEIMNAAITIYIYDSDMYIMYQRITVANQINRNFNISLVVFVDCAVISI